MGISGSGHFFIEFHMTHKARVLPVKLLNQIPHMPIWKYFPSFPRRSTCYTDSGCTSCKLLLYVLIQIEIVANSMHHRSSKFRPLSPLKYCQFSLWKMTRIGQLPSDSNIIVIAWLCGASDPLQHSDQSFLILATRRLNVAMTSTGIIE